MKSCIKNLQVGDIVHGYWLDRNDPEFVAEVAGILYGTPVLGTNDIIGFFPYEQYQDWKSISGFKYLANLGRWCHLTRIIKRVVH